MFYSAPGVFIRYVTEGPLVVRPASSSTAVFIGPTIRGRNIVAGTPNVITPTRITSLPEYVAQFATTGAQSEGVCLPTPGNAFEDVMGHAVHGAFLNGLRTAYIVSTSQTTPVAASATLRVRTTNGNSDYTFTALSEGAWGNNVVVTASASPLGRDFCDVEISLTLTSDSEAGAPGAGQVVTTERFIGRDAASLETIASGIVRITRGLTGPVGSVLNVSVAAPSGEQERTLTGGVNASSALFDEFGEIFAALSDIDDISLIALPGRVWPAAQAEYSHAIAHCQAMKDRIVLIQLADGTTDFGAVSVPLDKFASVYFPSATVTLKQPRGARLTQTIGLTAHVAGVIARIDGDKGPWTAAGGVHADIRGITTLTQDISQTKQESINPENINAIRYIGGLPTIWGARTRDKGGIYEYQPVMRTAILIADNLRTALEQFVFAKNTERTWSNIKAGVNGFMQALYALGAFQGPTPSSAFEVAVGLGESMTQAEIDGGLMRVTVRFRPAKPAEFIEVSVEQLVGAA